MMLELRQPVPIRMCCDVSLPKYLSCYSSSFKLFFYCWKDGLKSFVFFAWFRQQVLAKEFVQFLITDSINILRRQPKSLVYFKVFFNVLRDTPVNSLIFNFLSPCAWSLKICLSLLMSVFLLAIIPLLIIIKTAKIIAYFLNMRIALFGWSVCSGARWSICSGEGWSV